MRLDRAVPTRVTLVDEKMTIIVDPEYLAHCGAIAHIIACSDYYNVDWRLRKYLEVAQPGRE